MTSKTATLAKRPSKPAAASAALEPDLKQATDLVLELMAIPSTSGHEGLAAEFVRSQLLLAGASSPTFIPTKPIATRRCAAERSATWSSSCRARCEPRAAC